jgi:hypothetical protein
MGNLNLEICFSPAVSSQERSQCGVYPLHIKLRVELNRKYTSVKHGKLKDHSNKHTVLK